MTKDHFDPDLIQRENPAYWGAVLALALRDGDRARAQEATQQLKRWGIHLSSNRSASRKGGNHAAR